jgi:ABC-type transporter Mla MlaB component
VELDEPIAVAVRPGEHACCRFAHADDRRGAALAFTRDALRRGNKVVYLCESEDTPALAAELAAAAAEVGAAIDSGQLELRRASGAYKPGGSFDVDGMLRSVKDERERALADGYPALSMTGDMSWAVQQATDAHLLPEYERRFAEVMDDGDFDGLCQYDHGQFDAATLSEIADAHVVDLSPELAALVRTGCLAGARVDGRTLRLAGELDFACADTLISILGSHFHGPLELDLADLDYVDVAGMRALRGRMGQQVTITGASDGVRRLLALLGWDTEPDVELVA